MSTDTQQDAREQARHQIAVMQAWVDGKEIEYQHKGNRQWMAFSGPVTTRGFDHRNHNYRVKTEERKPRETVLWVNDEDPSMRLSCTICRPPAGAWRQATFREVLPETETES